MVQGDESDLEFLKRQQEQDKQSNIMTLTELRDGVLSGNIFQTEYSTKGPSSILDQYFDLDQNGWFVDTDYESYQIAYMCNDVGEGMIEELVYIDVRDPNLTQEQLEKIKLIAQEKITDQMTEHGGDQQVYKISDMIQIEQGEANKC